MNDPFTRPPIARFHLIAAILTAAKPGSLITCEKIAERLEVTTKTVFRDLEFMRDRLGLPIESKRTPGGGFYLTGRIKLCAICTGKASS